jgi:hypothetical protein
VILKCLVLVCGQTPPNRNDSKDAKTALRNNFDCGRIFGGFLEFHEFGFGRCRAVRLHERVAPGFGARPRRSNDLMFPCTASTTPIWLQEPGIASDDGGETPVKSGFGKSLAVANSLRADRATRSGGGGGQVDGKCPIR